MRATPYLRGWHDQSICSFLLFPAPRLRPAPQYTIHTVCTDITGRFVFHACRTPRNEQITGDVEARTARPATYACHPSHLSPSIVHSTSTLKDAYRERRGGVERQHPLVAAATSRHLHPVRLRAALVPHPPSPCNILTILTHCTVTGGQQPQQQLPEGRKGKRGRARAGHPEIVLGGLPPAAHEVAYTRHTNPRQLILPAVRPRHGCVRARVSPHCVSVVGVMFYDVRLYAARATGLEGRVCEERGAEPNHVATAIKKACV